MGIILPPNLRGAFVALATLTQAQQNPWRGKQQSQREHDARQRLREIQQGGVKQIEGDAGNHQIARQRLRIG